jgi:hypothetical protein
MFKPKHRWILNSREDEFNELRCTMNLDDESQESRLIIDENYGNVIFKLFKI